MARIRSIKPEYWTDEKIVELTIPARLLFVGSWNFADDQGYLEASAKQLKLRILPSDKINGDKLVAELFAHGLLEEVEDAEGKRWWHIVNWNRHQKPQHPSAARVIDPKPVFAGDSHILMGPHESSPTISSGEERSSSGEESYIRHPDFDQIFQAWIAEKTLTQHHAPTAAMRRAAQKTLTDHSLTTIIQAISLYATVLVSEKHFFTYRWTLDEFLQRGVDKFVPDTDPLTRYFGTRQNGSIASSDRDPAAAHRRDVDKCRREYEALIAQGLGPDEARVEVVGMYRDEIIDDALPATKGAAA